MTGKRLGRYFILKINIVSFAKDVEKATEPFMERARQIKEEVTIATNDLKQTVDKNNDVIRNKTGNLNGM